uniref:CWC25 spliceosome associated protein homolog n=1 Tax=Leptobrachium leishanense TaxID=445787 RepID=A0A8C5Q9U6_9ANUR
GGGGFSFQNLKKSWHPQTLRNVEKVWKAEQKHEAEKKKIEELQKELREERAREEMQRYAEDTGAVKKKDEKLDWMYQGLGGMVNREEYLLGRPVDKFILDKMQEPESGPSTETGLLPGSIFNSSCASSALDIANKIREDPLFMIRKKEDEKKREVLKNPVKMKKIRELLQTSLDKKSKKKKKEKKKRRKERRASSSSEEQGSSGDEDHGRSRPSRSQTPAFSRERIHRLKRPGRKLSAEELERRRLEMMEDAKQRERDRESNVHRYKQEEDKEREKDQQKKESKFLHNMKLESAATSSLEDRVKRNIHGIQRTSAALEKNFMKR